MTYAEARATARDYMQRYPQSFDFDTEEFRLVFHAVLNWMQDHGLTPGERDQVIRDLALGQHAIDMKAWHRGYAAGKRLAYCLEQPEPATVGGTERGTA